MFPPGRGAQRAEVLRLARAALSAPSVRRAFAAADARREAPFLSRHALPEGDVVYLDGKVDLVFREAAGWVVVDYKTIRVPPGGADALAARYRGQGLAYALGLSTLLRAPVVEVVFVFLDTGEERSVAIDADARAEALARLAEAARRARASEARAAAAAEMESKTTRRKGRED